MNPETFCDGGYVQAVNVINSEKSQWTWNFAGGWNESQHLQQNALNVRPSLTCNGNTWNILPTVGGGMSGNGIADLSAGFEPCDWSWSHDFTITLDGHITDMNGNIIPPYPNHNIFDWIPCGTGNSNPNNPWQNWPELYDILTLSPSDPNNTNGPIVVDYKTSTITRQSTGEAAVLTDFAQGLYHAVFLFSDNSFLSRYIYFKDDLIITTLEKDHLAVMASPVPVTNNKFVLDLNSDINLSFTFKLMTTSGTVLHEKNYDIRSEENLQDTITINNYNQPGTLICHFQFGDGSTKSFNISKL